MADEIMRWRPINEAPTRLQTAVADMQAEAGRYRDRLVHVWNGETKQIEAWIIGFGYFSAGTGVTHYLDEPIPMPP
jgi:hypothetical protein